MPITATVTTASTTADGSNKPDASTASLLAHDPILQQLTWAVAIVALIISLGKPLRDYIRGEKKSDKVDKVETARSDAETILYEHLSEQVSQYRTIADQAFRERNALIGRVAALEAKAEDLVTAGAVIEKLKIRLDKKDEEIRLLLEQGREERKQLLDILRSKENEIEKRDERILILEQGQHELEIRLAKGESAINTFSCPMKGGHRSTDIPLGKTTPDQSGV
jgi:hypothetical protein